MNHSIFILFTSRSAWKTVALIGLISFLINLWVPFMFVIQRFNNNNISLNYCDINTDYKEQYFLLNMIYIFLIMLIPILIIIVCNTLIIYKTFKNDTNRKKLQKETKRAEAVTLVASRLSIADPIEMNVISCHTSDLIKNRREPFKPHYLTVNQMINKKNRKSNTSKIFKTLAIISFSYVILNMPYLLTWMLYFYQTALSRPDIVTQNYLLMLLEFCEMFYVLNYAVKFYIYCASSSVFCEQLKYSRDYFIYYINIKLFNHIKFYFILRYQFHI